VDIATIDLLTKLLKSSDTNRPIEHTYFVQKGEASSLIVGTLHATPSSHRDFLKPHLRSVKTLLLEVSPHELELKDRMLFDFARRTDLSLNQLLSEQDVQRVRKALPLKYRLLPKYRALTETPWIVRLLIIRKIFDRNMWRPVEAHAYEAAQELGLPTIGLETLREQYEAMAALDQQYILESLRTIHTFEESYKVTIDIYYRGDLGEIDKLLYSDNPHYAVARRMAEIRNGMILQRMMPFLEEGGVAILLGIAHCPSLFRELRDLGFSIEKMTPSI